MLSFVPVVILLAVTVNPPASAVLPVISVSLVFVALKNANVAPIIATTKVATPITA